MQGPELPKDIRYSAPEPNGRGTPFGDENRQLDDMQRGARRTNDELARENIAVDDAAFDDGEYFCTLKRLRTVGVRAPKIEEQA